MGIVRLDVTNLKQIREKMRKLKADLEDMDPLWERISDIMVEETETLWATEGDTAVPPWPGLAPSTVRRKMKHGLPLDPMVESWALFESLTDPLQAGELGQGKSTLGTFTSKQFSWGTEVTNERGDTYAEFHQEGPDHNPDLPVRNVINVTPALLTRIDEAAEDWIRDMVWEAGLK